MKDRGWIEEFYSYGTLIKYTQEQKELLLANAPSALYQYRDITEQNLENIRNGIIWASAVERFNDPFDCDFNLSLMKEWGKRKLVEHPEMTMRMYLSAVEKSMLKLRHSTAVSCFSEEYDSILMWSHYANRHKGMCVCYDPTDILKSGSTLFPVWYRNEKVNPYEYKENEILKLNGRIKEIFIQKSPEWSYEKEWRIIKVVENDTAEKKIEMNHGVEVKTIFPKCILLGACAEKKLVDKVKELGKEKGINVVQMLLADNEYKLKEKYFVD